MIPGARYHRGAVRDGPYALGRQVVRVQEDLAGALGDGHDQVGPREHLVFEAT